MPTLAHLLTNVKLRISNLKAVYYYYYHLGTEYEIELFLERTIIIIKLVKTSNKKTIICIT